MKHPSDKKYLILIIFFPAEKHPRSGQSSPGLAASLGLSLFLRGKYYLLGVEGFIRKPQTPKPTRGGAGVCLSGGEPAAKS